MWRTTSKRRDELQQAIQDNLRQNILHARELNSLGPFPGRLPQEVLSEIIRLYVTVWKAENCATPRFGFYWRTCPGSPGSLWASREYGWISITHVCHALRVAAHFDSSLWTDISLVECDFVNLILQHIGPTKSLSVKVRRNADYLTLEKLPSLTHRIHKLDLQLNLAQYERFRKYFSRKSFVNLKSLTLAASMPQSYRETTPPLPRLFESCYPNLTELSIGNFSLKSLPRLLGPQPQLKSLSILQSDGDTVTIEELVKILMVTPALEFLQLDEVFGAWWQETNPLTPPLSLPHLHTLKMHASERDSFHLLERIHTPHLEIFELHSFNRHRTDPYCQSLLSLVANTFDPIQSLSVVCPDFEGGLWIRIQGFVEYRPAVQLLHQHCEPIRGFTFHFRPNDEFDPSDMEHFMDHTKLFRVRSLCLGHLPPEATYSRFPMDTLPHHRRIRRSRARLSWDWLISHMPNIEQLYTTGPVSFMIPHLLSATKPPTDPATDPPTQKPVEPSVSLLLPNLRIVKIASSEFGPRHGVSFKELVESLSMRATRYMKLEKLIIQDTANLGDIEAKMIREHVGELDWDRCRRCVNPNRYCFSIGEASSEHEDEDEDDDSNVYDSIDSDYTYSYNSAEENF